MPAERASAAPVEEVSTRAPADRARHKHADRGGERGADRGVELGADRESGCGPRSRRRACQQGSRRREEASARQGDAERATKMFLRCHNEALRPDEAAPANASATAENETNLNAEMPRPMKLFARTRSLSNDEYLQQPQQRQLWWRLVSACQYQSNGRIGRTRAAQ